MTSRSKSGGETVKCELCNVTTPTIIDQVEHDASLIHHMKIDQFHKGFWNHLCGICNTTPGKLKNYIIHLKSRKHENQLIQVKGKWASKSNFVTPSTFFLSNHTRKSNNFRPDERATSGNETVQDFQKGPNPSDFLSEQNTFQQGSQRPWTTQNYNTCNVPWNNQDSYQWNGGNYNNQQYWNQPNPALLNNNWSQVPYYNQNGYNSWNVTPQGQWLSNNEWVHNRATTSYHNRSQPPFNKGETSRTNKNDNHTNLKQLPQEPQISKAAVLPGNSKESDSTSGIIPKSKISNRERSNSKNRDKSGFKNQTNFRNRTYQLNDKSKFTKTISQKLNTKSKDTIMANLKSDDGKNSSISSRGKNIQHTAKKVDKNKAESKKTDKQNDNSSKTASKNKINESANDPISDNECGSSKSESKTHLYFLSSDSDGEGGKVKALKSNKNKVGKSGLNQKKNENYESFNQNIIRRLVNHPCTPRQQMQLTRWLQSQSTCRKISLPRYNLPSNEESSALENVMNELPEDILNTLYQAIEKDDLNEPEMEVCLKAEAIDDNSGNIPWVDFLKSLEEKSNIPEDNFIDTDEPENIMIANEKNKQLPENENSQPKVVIKHEPGLELPHKEDGTCQPEIAVNSSTIPIINNKDTNVTRGSISCQVEVDTPISSITIKTEPLETQTSDIPEIIHDTRKDSFPTPPRNITPQNERSTPSSSVRRAPSISSCNLDPISFDQSQKEVHDWINQLNTPDIAECVNIPPTTSSHSALNRSNAGSETGTPKNLAAPSQEIVDELLFLNLQEEQLRDQYQKVEQVIGQLYRLVEEWKNKRNEILLQETNFRNKRLKLLENLRGVVTNEKSPITNMEANSLPKPSPLEPQNVRYLGTLESTLNFVNELGMDLGINLPVETPPNVSSSTTINEGYTPDSSSLSPKIGRGISKTKKTKKKNSASEQVKVSKKKTRLISNESKKIKKKKRSENSEISSTSAPLPKKRKISKNKVSTDDVEQERMLKDYLSTDMPKNLGIEMLTSSTLSPFPGSVNESSDVHLTDCESPSEILIERKTFGPLNIHENAIIDMKIDKGFMYTCSSDKTANRIDMMDTNECILYHGHESTVSSIQIHHTPDSCPLIFTSCHDSFLRCFNSDTGKCISQLCLSSPIVSMAYAWSMLFLGLQDGSIIPYNITTSSLLDPILGSADIPISYIQTVSEGCQRILFIIDYNGVVTVRNAMTGLFIRRLQGTVKPPCRITVNNLMVYVTTMAKTVLIYDLMTGNLKRKISSTFSSATGIAFQGNMAICCYLDGSIKCYNKYSWQLKCIFYNPEKTMPMCMELQNNWVYTGNRYGSVQGFQLDFSNIKSCKYLKCSFPFGRDSDLRKHVDEDHISKADIENVKICPWNECESDFASFTDFDKKSHILMHIEN